MGAASSAWARRSARPGSPGSSARSETGALGLRCTGEIATSAAHGTRLARLMAKKDKKKGKKDPKPADAVGAVRTAVERTFQATADSAQSTRTRAQDLVDEVAGAAGRVREMIEDIRVLEDLKGLRTEVDALTRRVAELESGAPAKGAGRGTARKPAGRAAASRKPSASAKKPRSSAATTR